MILRIWLGLSLVVIVGAWVLMVPLSPDPANLSASNLSDYRDQGLMPAVGGFSVSEAVPHSVFEIPDDDAVHLAEEMAAMGMEGMDMGGGGGGGMAMNMDDDDDEDGGGMAMNMDDDDDVEKPTGGMTMNMGDDDDEEKPTGGMAMNMGDDDDEDGGGMAMNMGDDEDGHGGGGMASGLTFIAQGTSEEVAAAASRLNVTRTVAIEMREWGYGPDTLMVKPGEIVRMVVKNGGKLPHEFMLMTMAGMNAVNYRIRRADWNLLEHEAEFEVAIVMPGDTIELIVQIHKPGAWMFMCMFPNHMQLGMMGTLMTEGFDMSGMTMKI